MMFIRVITLVCLSVSVLTFDTRAAEKEPFQTVPSRKEFAKGSVAALKMAKLSCPKELTAAEVQDITKGDPSNPTDQRTRLDKDNFHLRALSPTASDLREKIQNENKIVGGVWLLTDSEPLGLGDDHKCTYENDKIDPKKAPKKIVISATPK